MTRTARFPDCRIPISSPADLESVLREAKERVREGRLRQVEQADTVFGAVRLFDLPDAGQWPDFIEMHFRNTEGAGYRLVAETYHGTGGEWVPDGSEPGGVT